MNKIIILVIILVAEAFTTLAVLLSKAFPHRRIWPPAQPRSSGQIVMLFLFCISAAGTILLGILDWDSFIFPAWVRIAAGLPIWLSGNFLALWSLASLGIAPSSGNEAALVQHGPYRFSRNPQYLGFMIGLVGWVLMTDSALTFIAFLGALLPLGLVPYVEEPWLLAIHGSQYADYMRAVPRFFSFKYFKPA